MVSEYALCRDPRRFDVSACQRNRVSSVMGISAQPSDQPNGYTYPCQGATVFYSQEEVMISAAVWAVGEWPKMARTSL